MLVDLEKLNFEDEVGIRGDDTTGTASTISVVARDLQGGL